MAAIDKIYATNYDDYLKFKEWCETLPRFQDKYGRDVSIMEYVYNWDKPWEGEHPVFMGPRLLDAYLIINCPFDFVQKELKINYGDAEYDKIKNAPIGCRYLFACSMFPYEDYWPGKHLRCTKHPKAMYNTPFGCKYWDVQINEPDDVPSMWYHEDTNTWDFITDFVHSDRTSNTAMVKTIRALKRHVRKWMLPIGTKIIVYGKYVEDAYEFIVTK